MRYDNTHGMGQMGEPEDHRFFPWDRQSGLFRLGVFCPARAARLRRVARSFLLLPFCSEHRPIGLLHERARVSVPSLMDGNADADSDMKTVSFNLKCSIDRHLQPLCRIIGTADLGRRE